MKKTLKIVSLSLILALVIPFTSLNAQIFDKGDIVMSAGIGLGSTYYAHGSAYKTTMLPIFLTGDYCLKEDLGPGSLGVGAYLGYSSYKYDYSLYDWYVKYSTIIIAARGTYHFTELVDKLDLYGGVLLGVKIQTHKYSDPDLEDYYNATGSGVAYSLFAGARYYFTDNFGAMAELGYGIAWLSLGVSLKF
jgi:hypothetical protein